MGYNRKQAVGGQNDRRREQTVQLPSMSVKASRSITLLLVEDSPGDVRLTREALRDSQLQVRLEVVQNGEDALNFLFQRAKYKDAVRPDLVLLDLNLPRVSGRQVLEAVKQDPDLQLIPILVMTTSNNPQDILTAYRLHANAFIQKPVDLNEFWDVMRAIENFWLRLAVYPPVAAEADARA